MLNCSDPECILHHHHYYHGRVQHHLQDDRMHHEHPTHHPMSGASDGAEDSIIQGYLNDTNSELSSLAHLDAPNESVYMICGVLIAMLLVGLIIILLAVTISKLRKREESSTVTRTQHGHPQPEGVFQTVSATVADGKQQRPPPPSTQAAAFTLTPLPFVPSDASLCSVASNDTCETSYSLPLFLYSTTSHANSHASLNLSEQRVPVHQTVPDEHSKPHKGKFRKLVRKKNPPSPTYAIPIEFQDQLKKIYVY